ncbi:organic solute transporter subunit beta [Bufo gargarizans]|uniref:organic solute transporter subunit beta n=1 Tax=Bufo gargarizans TaxID=30331 RepID=UPI001CF5A5FE|nr:organic solute transporter subunit beta [Bufo gargarizans]XP_044139107.1 organic solute transporter subunit beta [Bufo gargarizans]
MADTSRGQDQAMAAAEEAQKKLERAIYFYRSGDLTAWNYTILALSFLGLFLGLFLLGKNIFNNRKRKMIAMYNMNMDAKKEEPDGKQAVLMLEKENLPQEDALLKKEAQPGDITVQWKDGQITSLYTDVPEEDV